MTSLCTLATLAENGSGFGFDENGSGFGFQSALTSEGQSFLEVLFVGIKRQ